jgi:hypothetical protein
MRYSSKSFYKGRQGSSLVLSLVPDTDLVDPDSGVVIPEIEYFNTGIIYHLIGVQVTRDKLSSRDLPSCPFPFIPYAKQQSGEILLMSLVKYKFKWQKKVSYTFFVDGTVRYMDILGNITYGVIINSVNEYDKGIKKLVSKPPITLIDWVQTVDKIGIRIDWKCNILRNGTVRYL